MARRLAAVCKSVHELGSGQRLGLGPLVRLEQLLRELKPAVVHGWHLPALRALSTLRIGLQAAGVKFVIADPMLRGKWTSLDRWLLARADRVVFASPGQSKRSQLEANSGFIDIPLAVAPAAEEAPPWPIDLPDDARVILCIANLTPEHGVRDSLWGFDVLKYITPRYFMLVVGDGPERGALRRFGQAIARDDIRAKFVPENDQAMAWAKRAAVVWVTSRKPCGFQVVLEAQAAGAAVVGSEVDGMRTVIEPGVTGEIAPIGEPVTLAKITRPLLEQPELCARLGSAASQKVLVEHDVKMVVKQWIQVYAGVVQ